MFDRPLPEIASWPKEFERDAKAANERKAEKAGKESRLSADKD